MPICFIIRIFVRVQEIFIGVGKDARIGRRAGWLADKMVEKNSSVINFCCDTHAERVAAYRLINNPRLVMEEMVSAVASECSRLSKLLFIHIF